MKAYMIIAATLAACLTLTACGGAGFDPTSRDPFGSSRGSDKDADTQNKN